MINPSIVGLMLSYAAELSEVTDELRQKLADVGVAGVYLPGVERVLTGWNGQNDDAVVLAVKESLEKKATSIILPDCVCGKHVPVRVVMVGYARLISEKVLPLLTGQALLLSNGSTFTHSKELWQLLENIDRHGVQAIWSLAVGKHYAEPSSVAIPTLNSKIGAIRVSDSSPDTLTAINKIRGIGFDGMILIKPQAPDNIEEVIGIYQAIQLHIHPVKTKPAVTKKPA